MAIPAETSNDVDFSLRLVRNGEVVTNKEGAKELADFVQAVTVHESISSSAIRADIVIQDSADLVSTLTGSEAWVMIFNMGNSEAVYNMRAYNIDSRSRSGNSEVYIVQCVSVEFLVNEVRNVFGSSKELFGKSVKAKAIVEKLLKDYIYGKDENGNQNKTKNFFIEDSKNNHEFVCTNWRTFDTIYWVAQKSLRPSSESQNGFLFWESRLGYHFKSIDTMIDEAKAQTYEQKTDPKSGKARLYKYTYEPKKSGDEGNDTFRIDSIVFPEDKNYLKVLRDGSFAGYSLAFDPNDFSNSKLEPSTFTPLIYTFKDSAKAKKDFAGRDTINFWNKMSHLGGGKNPVDVYDESVKAMVNFPKRIRYSVLPNRIFDKPGSEKTDKKLYGELSYLQAYQHIRVTTLKNIQLLIKIPGNLDIYPGYGLEISIPQTKPKGDKIEKDRKYSGRYLVAGVRHLYDQKSVVTEVLLYRDSYNNQ
ncbi:hypothetical protein [Synechococcus phage S-B64]|uniref:Uncharacterized protein n=2 Tax=Shandvirus TaxID=2948904 RepID=A0A1Z1LWB9_9CAUD|nr:tail protein [Synechococcus phage S-H35]YP_010095367.1 tail protein [Synechococcus phage S-B64]ARW56946.1 hypothetical protein [Synechococcus phage S-H35]AWD90165.1 hypothetical protein [Synechococcus phage S-B64]